MPVWATGLPADWSVVVVSGLVDEAGADQSDPVSSKTRFAASSFVDGALTVDVTTKVSRYFRVQLANPAGLVCAYSNPVWVLRAPLGVAVPAARLAVPPPPAAT